MISKGAENDAFLTNSSLFAVLRIRDPMLFLTPGSVIRDGKKIGSGSGINIPNNFPESLETVLRVKNT
jgi:hypothetical protein